MHRKNLSLKLARHFAALLCVLALCTITGPVHATTAPPPAVGANCTAPGTTQMDAGQTEILACLYDPNDPTHTHMIWWRAGTAGVNLNVIPTCGLDPAGNQQVLNFNNTAGSTSKGSFYCFTP